MLVLKKTDGKVLKKTVGVSFEKNLGEFSISGVFSGMMMIFSLFSFRALSLFKFNVHFNFHFHCWDLNHFVCTISDDEDDDEQCPVFRSQ